MKKLLFWSFIIIITASGCRDIFGKRVRGSGNTKSEARSVSQFNNIDVSGAIDVYVKQDSVASVHVETDDNLLEYVEVINDGGTLDIHQRHGFNLRPSHKIKVFVSNPSFKHFEASGACNIYSENRITSNELVSIDLSGASDIKMEVSAPKVTADLSGASKITMKGETKEFRVDGSGATDIKCFDLMSENTWVEITGAGNAEVHASVKLDVHVSGAGDIKYKGNASVSQSVSGAGSVKKID